MSFEETFKDLLTRYIRRHFREDIAEVLSYVQDSRALIGVVLAVVTDEDPR